MTKNKDEYIWYKNVGKTAKRKHIPHEKLVIKYLTAYHDVLIVLFVINHLDCGQHSSFSNYILWSVCELDWIASAVQCST